MTTLSPTVASWTLEPMPRWTLSPIVTGSDGHERTTLFSMTTVRAPMTMSAVTPSSTSDKSATLPRKRRRTHFLAIAQSR
jgi:hypothetical protein